MQRITEKDLKDCVNDLRRQTGKDLTLSQAYGGNKIEVKNSQGGYADFLGTGFVTKRELYVAACQYSRGYSDHYNATHP